MRSVGALKKGAPDALVASLATLTPGHLSGVYVTLAGRHLAAAFGHKKRVQYPRPIYYFRVAYENATTRWV